MYRCNTPQLENAAASRTATVAKTGRLAFYYNKTIHMKLSAWPVLLLLFVSCDRKSRVPDDDRHQEGLIISEKQYQAAATRNYTISDARIGGDSLFITFGSGGCSGSNWKTAIIDAARVAESNPVQRYLKLRLVNNELCAAYFSKQVAVNIRSLRVNGTGTVSFNLNGWNQPLLYQY